MIATDEEIQTLKVVHYHLQPGERILLFGRCRLKGNSTKNLFLFYLILLVPALAAVLLSPLFTPMIVLLCCAALCAPIVLILSFLGRPFGFCALTDRRLIQSGRMKGVLEIASRNEVRQIVGTDNKILLIVAKAKENASAKELRLGVKAVQQIKLSPVRNLVDVVGGKELLIDQLGSNQ